MSVTVRARHVYRHPVEKVWAAFSDPEFYQHKFEGIGHRDVEVLASDAGDGEFTIETRRRVPLDVPGMLKKFLGEWNTVLQDERWCEGAEGEYTNELEITAEGVPASMTGAMTLAPAKSGCVNEVEITIRAGVPIIGGRLEQFVAEGTEAQLAAEYDFIRKYLDGRG